MEFKMDMTKRSKKAHHNPSTSNPSTSLSAINKIMALMQNKKSPKVINVIGIVTIINNGLTNAFSIANTMATITAS